MVMFGDWDRNSAILLLDTLFNGVSLWSFSNPQGVSELSTHPPVSADHVKPAVFRTDYVVPLYLESTGQFVRVCGIILFPHCECGVSEVNYPR